jgi:hypothetical protein
MGRSLFVLLASSGLWFGAALAESRQTIPSVSPSCRTYAECLQEAREALAHGDRQRALRALRRARALLASCRDVEAGETALARR